MAECAHCGESIESGESYGFRVRPIGNIEQLKGVLALMGGGADADNYRCGLGHVHSLHGDLDARQPRADAEGQGLAQVSALISAETA